MAKQRVPPWQGSKTVAENARRVLPILAEQYLEGCRKLLGEDASPQALRRWGKVNGEVEWNLKIR